MKNQYKVRTMICKRCGKEVTKRMPAGRKFCSSGCYLKGPRLKRRTGKVVQCDWCGKDVYKRASNKHLHKFCGLDCANKWQGRNKKGFICKICGKGFRLSKSLAESHGRNPTYCSVACRELDPDYMGHINGNLAQQNKKGLNKLELAGRGILQDLGIVFEEQVLMFNKFLVDVLLKNHKIVIQWDGVYWHTKSKRKKLDISQDAYMKKCGYKVIRITDIQIKDSKEDVCEIIKKAVQ